MTLISFTFYVGATYVSFLAIHIQTDVVKSALFTLTLILSRTINIIPGNIGLTELICGCMSQSLGETLGSGVIVSGIFRVIEYVTMAVCAGLLSMPALIKKEYVS